MFFDILTIQFLLRYLTRPMHFFGKFGLTGIVLGTLVLAYILVDKLAGKEILVEHGPLLVGRDALARRADVVQYWTDRRSSDANLF